MTKHKKAQVTVFIIIGAIILISTGAFIYFRTTAVKKEVEVGVRELEAVPLELQPIRTYVEAAIKQTTEEGLRILGQHGGYIYLDRFSSNLVEPTESESLDYFGIKLPYWYYMESPNGCSSSCSFNSEMPPLCKQGRGCITNGKNSIEEELEKYINNELEKSLNNFESLQDFEITKEAAPKANVIIRDKSIVIYVEYPLELKKPSSSKIKHFQAIIESGFTEMYETAYDIKNYETNNCFIEKHLTNYISSFMGLDSKKLPPTYDSTIGVAETIIWPLFQVKENLKKKTFTALNQIGIWNTSGYVDPIDDPNDIHNLRLREQYIFYPLKRFHDVTVTLEYNPSLNPYLNILPNDGSILMPTNIEVGFGLAKLFQHLTRTKIYEFNYMYSFPVVVDIKKQDSRGKIHTFRFALESNIRANECFKQPDQITNIVSLQSELCLQEERRNDLTVNVKDEETGKPLSNVEVYFYAGETCNLGFTDNNGKLVTKHPNAYGAFLKLKKEGYLDRQIHQSDFKNKLQTTLKPLKEKSIVLRLIEENTLKQMPKTPSQSDALAVRNSNLQLPKNNDVESETILITLTREPDNYQDAPFEQTLYFSEGKTTPEKLGILPGNYNVSIQLYLNKDITIPEEHDRVCVKGGLLGSCDKVPKNPLCRETDFEKTDNPKCYLEGYYCKASTTGNCDGADEDIKYDEINFTTIPNGGMEYNNWKIKNYNDLNKGENIIFYLFRQDIPTRHHHLNNLMKYQDYSKDFEYAVMPRVK